MHSKFFFVFLLCYTGVLVTHVAGSSRVDLLTLTALLGGAVVALAAHKRHSYAPIVFLAAHMTLECYYHTRHVWHYTNSELFIHGIHIIFDVWFLWIESAHVKKWRFQVLGLVVVILACVAWHYHVPAPKLVYPGMALVHQHEKTILGMAILGGVLGCVFFHLWATVRRKKTPCSHGAVPGA